MIQKRRKRMPRTAIVPSEKGQHVVKTITSGDLDAGKKQPAKFPGGSSVKPKEEKPKMPPVKDESKEEKPKMPKTKAIDLMEVDEDTLKSIHLQLHKEYSQKAEHPNEGNTTEDIMNQHAIIVDILKAKGISHPVPPNGLDEISADFESDNFHVSKNEPDTSHVDTPADAGGGTDSNETGKVEHITKVSFDPFAFPSEDIRKRFTIHNHWCGKSAQRDLLIETEGELALRCRTDPVTVDDAVKNLDSAKKHATDLSDALNNDNESAVLIPVAVELDLVPKQWLDIEGKTKEPKAGTPPPVGGDENNPGVYHILDHGLVEYGMQLPGMSELFIHGKTETKRILLSQGDDGKWSIIEAQNQVPYVLSKDAIEKNQHPPKGVSALPWAIKGQIPAKYKFWTAKNDDDVVIMQNNLYRAICTKHLKVDFNKTCERDELSIVEKHKEPRFVVQKQSYDDADIYWIRMDMGGSELNSIKFDGNPLTNSHKNASIHKESQKDSMGITGEIRPSHFMNWAKRAKSNVELIDEGTVKVVSQTGNATLVEFSGSKVEGLYQIENQDGVCNFKPASEEQELKKYMAEVKFEVEIAKVADEKQLVYGVVLEPNEVDAHNDTIKPDAIEKAAHKFLAKYNKSTKMGIQHKLFGNIGVELYQSYIAPTSFKLGGKKVKKGSWIMVTHITDSKLWKNIKEGKITGYSIGGIATVV